MSRTRLDTFNNSWYKPGSAVKRLLWYMVNAVFFKSAFPFSAAKISLLRLFGARIGSRVLIKPYVNIKYPWFLVIGNNVWIGEDVWIDNLGKVIIGDDCCISQGALLLCGNHNYSLPSFDLIVGDIELESGVWIGAKSIVCPGVKCASHAVLAAGSVANKNLDAFSVYQGNPAQKIRERKMQS
jgi:putative colanic acid biosynthesis acetyltransferase WcaF